MDILANAAAAILDLTRQKEEESQNGAIHDWAEQISKSDLHHDDSSKKRRYTWKRNITNLKDLFIELLPQEQDQEWVWCPKDKTWRMKTNELETVIWYSTTYTLFNQGEETNVHKFKELLEKQLYKKPLNPEAPSFSPTQHYNVKLEIDKIWNAINSIRGNIDTENTPSVNSLIREISALQTTIAHVRSENSSLKTANRLLQDEISNNKTLQDELLSIIDSTKETTQQTERGAAKPTEYEQIFQQVEEINFKDSFTVQLERIRKEKKEKFERHRNKNSEAIAENNRSICSNIPMALLVDTPKVNAFYDSDRKIFEEVDILHENKEINTLAVENEELEKQIKTLKEKLD